jgi:2-octaprenyl-6-methoxyphenol hydroxylase
VIYQVIIVGGGLAGACLALALSQQSQGTMTIALIEAHPPALQPPAWDDRAIALAYHSCQELTKLGLWPLVASEATAIHSIQVSEAQQSAFATLRSEEYRLPQLGQVVAMTTLRQQLARLLTTAAGITVYAPAEVVSVIPQAHQVLVSLQQGEVLAGNLLVIAAGSDSPLSKQLALRYQRWDHQQLAIVATLATAEPHQGRAFERFTRDGSLAVLPKTAEQCAVVWCQPKEHQRQLMSLDDHAFLQQLQQLFGWRLGALLHVRKRHCYPLSTQVALRPVGHRWVAVGNAAQTLHPIAGQGFNLALRDVLQLADCLISAWRQQQDVGTYSLLADYRQRRQRDQQRMVKFTQGLLQLFGSQQPLLKVGRTVGLSVFERSSFIKKRVASWLLGTPSW